MAAADPSLIARAPFHNYPWDFLDLKLLKINKITWEVVKRRVMK
jgi:hypothetical protein